MKINARILSLSLGAVFFASVTAHAADATTPAAGSSLIDLGGQVVTAGLAGGMTDPVPLFAGDNGPAVFVIDIPGVTDTSGDLETSMTSTVKKGFEPPQARTLYGPRH